MRPNNALITSTTPGGIRFQYDLEQMRSKGARDAGVEQLLVLIDWADRDAFLKEVVGFTTWNKTNTLQRSLPLRHPLRKSFWCEEYELFDYGIYDTTEDVTDALNNHAPRQDWCRYTLTFTKPHWRLFTDAELNGPMFGLDAGKEQYRYTTITQMPRPRERVVSGQGYEYQKADGTWVAIPDERQFIPDYQIDHVVTWVQIPIVAMPYVPIINALNTTNSDAIRLSSGSKLWVPGELLFKGLAEPLQEYAGADDALYYDLKYLFTSQPGGWNNYLVRDGAGNKDYRPVRIKGGAGAGFPPYPSSTFQSLFTPG